MLTAHLFQSWPASLKFSQTGCCVALHGCCCRCRLHLPEVTVSQTAAGRWFPARRSSRREAELRGRQGSAMLSCAPVPTTPHLHYPCRERWLHRGATPHTVVTVPPDGTLFLDSSAWTVLPGLEPAGTPSTFTDKLTNEETSVKDPAPTCRVVSLGIRSYIVEYLFYPAFFRSPQS